MLDEKHIPIGTLKQIYSLNTQDVERLLDKLLPDGVFPYALWQEADTALWRSCIHENAQRDQLEIPVFPNVKELFVQDFSIDIHVKLLVEYFVTIFDYIQISVFDKGLDYIIGNAYDGNVFQFIALKEDIIYLMNSIKKSSEQYGGGRILASDASMFRDNAYFFMDKFYQDTIVVDKNAAMLHCIKCGYRVRQEHKGITFEMEKRLMATIDAHPQEDAAAPDATVFRIPRALWEGKSPKGVCIVMKEKNYALPVIALVLRTWCKVKTKKELGILLGDGYEKDESAHRRYANGLLKAAEGITIISV